MKKIIFSMLLMVGLLLFPVNCFAEAQDNTFSFKVGSNVITINGEDVKMEKPYMANKATMVPVNAFKNAFAAAVEHDTKKNTVTVTYSEVQIVFTLKSSTALVNGAKVTLPAAPEIKSNLVMVPLEVVCSHIGADIKKDEKTSVITVVKEIAGENSIKDFSLILKKTKKDKIGDSYYKWSINHPKDLKISYREFAGDYMEFEAVDQSYALYLSIDKQSDESIDSIMASELEWAKDYTLIFHEKVTKNNQLYVKTAYTAYNGKGVTESRVYLNNGYVYYLTLDVSDGKDYNKSSKYAALMDSFNTVFEKNNSIEDLSDVDSNQLRVYESKDLKWSLKIPANYIKSNTNRKNNDVLFYDEDDGLSTISAGMYSIEKDLTLDSWVEHDVKKFNDSINPSFGQIVKITDAATNGLKSKYVLSKIKAKDKEYYTCQKYTLGKNYRYSVSYCISSSAYNDNSKKARYDSILESFRFSEPKAEDIGQIIDAAMLPEAMGSRTISNTEFKWSVELPVSWVAGSLNNNKNVAQYTDKNNNVLFQLAVIKDGNVEEFRKYYEETLLKQATVTGKFENTGKETLSDKGTTIYKYVNKVKQDDSDIIEYYYLIGKNNSMYSVSFLFNELHNSSKNGKIINAIWNSIKFE